MSGREIHKGKTMARKTKKPARTAKRPAKSAAKRAPARKKAVRKRSVRRKAPGNKGPGAIERLENAIEVGAAEIDDLALSMGLLGAVEPKPRRKRR